MIFESFDLYVLFPQKRGFTVPKRGEEVPFEEEVTPKEWKDFSPLIERPLTTVPSAIG